VPLTPLNYALPMLLRHRLKASGASARMARRAPLVALPMAALALLALALGSVRSDLWLGSAYDGLHGLVAWLMLAGMAEAVMRVFTVDAQAEGQPWRSAWAEGVRVLVLLLGFHAGGSLGFARPIEALAAWWALAAFAALGVLWALTPNASPEPHAA